MALNNKRATLQLDMMLDRVETIKRNLENRRSFHNEDNWGDPEQTFTIEYATKLDEIAGKLLEAEYLSDAIK